MSDKKLGRGLDLLIRKTSPTAADAPRTGTDRIAISSITPNPFQPRRDFGIDALNDLIESIRQHGVLQPIAVRPHAGGYQLISGERRWRASQELGLETIPAQVLPASDVEMLEFALIENIQREDLNPIEKALGYRELMAKFDLTQEQLAQRLSQSRSTIANTLRLLDLDDDIQKLLRDGSIQAGHARALLAISDPQVRRGAAMKAAQGELNVRELEDIATAPSRPDRLKPATSPTQIVLDDVARSLSETLGLQVAIRGTARRGRIMVEYGSRDELEQLILLLKKVARRDEDNMTEERADDATLTT